VLEAWKVLPHGKLVEVDDGLLTVVGRLQMPLAEIPRRMTDARLADEFRADAMSPPA
jgi:hypothetical protein